jgi:cysteine rich repeat protein
MSMNALPMLRRTTAECRKFGRILQLVLPFVAVGRDRNLFIHAGKAMHFLVGCPPPSKRNVRDKMLRFFLPITLLLLSASAPAWAEEARSGTAEEQKACTRDVQKFCRHVIDQGDFTILACLKENRPKISEACDSVLKNHNQ